MSQRYWDEVVAEIQDSRPMHAWRAYMHRVYQRLIHDWLDPKGKVALKTDLFEEAVTPFCPLSDLGENAIGIDISWKVAHSARENSNHSNRFLVADLRNIPFQAGFVDRILSGSSLDHFSETADLDKGLSELARILRPGGILVLTLDNPHNPLIWIRNHLPFRLLNELGIVPYYVGKTLSRNALRTQLQSLGFTVSDVRAVAHAPRAPAIWMVRIAERFQWNTDSLQAFLQGFEQMQKWPTRFVTGYYLAVRAVKGS